jgi:hypothetical protein
VVDAPELRVNASGASRIEVAGSGSSLQATVRGASRVDALDFPVKMAHVDIDGASRAFIDASDTLEGNISGAARLRYEGDPQVTRLLTTGAGDAEREEEPEASDEFNY